MTRAPAAAATSAVASVEWSSTTMISSTSPQPSTSRSLTHSTMAPTVAASSRGEADRHDVIVAWLRSAHGGRSGDGGTQARPEGPIARWHVTHEAECDSAQRGLSWTCHEREGPSSDHSPHPDRRQVRGRSRGRDGRRGHQQPRSAHPGFADRLLDENGLRRFVNVFVADDDVRFLDGLDTKVPDGETVSIIPAVAGGSR